MPKKTEPEMELRVDGVLLDPEDFTFEELDEYRRLVRESSEDPEANSFLAAPQDKWPAMVTIIKRRADPEYTLADAKKLKPADLLTPVKTRPTRTGTAKK